MAVALIAGFMRRPRRRPVLRACPGERLKTARALPRAISSERNSCEVDLADGPQVPGAALRPGSMLARRLAQPHRGPTSRAVARPEGDAPGRPLSGRQRSPRSSSPNSSPHKPGHEACGSCPGQRKSRQRLSARRRPRWSLPPGIPAALRNCYVRIRETGLEGACRYFDVLQP